MEIDTVVEKNGDVDGGSNFYFSSERKIVSDKLVEALNGKSGLASLSNRQEYEKRLLTFQASTYYAKPPCLSPIFCARFGWENADKDMLVCSGCSSALAITLNSKLSANTFDRLCQAYRNKIVSCHATSCPFRLPSIEQLESLADAEDGSKKIVKENNVNGVKRVRLVVPAYMGQALPEDTIRLMEHPRPSALLRQNARILTDKVRSNSMSGAASSPSSWSVPRLQIPSKIRQMNSSLGLTKFLDCENETILALSLLGWNPIPNAISDHSAGPIVSFGCPCCLSIMDLRLEPQSPVGNVENIEESPTKRQRISSRSLDPLEAHRHYCPYKVGFPEKAGHINPVWKIILNRLCEEVQCSKIEEATAVEEMPSVIAMGALDKSVDNVRRILRAGIATRKVDLMV